MLSGERATCLVRIVVFNLIVARRAQELLEQNNPAALQAALEVLRPLKENYPNLTTDEGDHPFTECAQFADNIKLMGFTW